MKTDFRIHIEQVGGNFPIHVQANGCGGGNMYYRSYEELDDYIYQLKQASMQAQLKHQ